MLKITKSINENIIAISLKGRLDTITAPMLEAEIRDIDPSSIIKIGLPDLEYLSSAGLRVLLAAQKKLNKSGKLEIYNASPEVKEIFDVTGFTDILNII